MIKKEIGYRDFDHLLEMEFKRLDVDENLTDKDRKLVRDFIKDCIVENKSPARNIFYLHHLRMMKKFIKKDFLSADNKADIKDFMIKVQPHGYSVWTMQNFKITLKVFYRWVHETIYKETFKKHEYPESVEWISTTMKNGGNKLPEDILTEDDVKKLIEACDTIRDKAFVSILWDSGCRIGEVLSLKLKHLSFDKYGAVIVVDGKTGMRRVRLIPSVPYLANWKEHHPRKNDPNAPLFVGQGTRNINRQLGYNAVDAFMRRLRLKTKFKKRINAHSFRHARATFFASRVKESVMKETFGWTKGSNMVAIYVHLSGRDVDNEILKAQGVVKEEEYEESKLKPKACAVCKKLNSPADKFCSACGKILDVETAIEIEKKREATDSVMNKLVEDPEIKKLLIKKILDSGLKKEMVES